MSTPNGVMVRTAATASGRRRSTVWPTLRAIYIIWYRDVLRYWRDRTRLVASLAQPLLFLVVFGTGLSSALSGAGGGAAIGGAAGAAAGLTYTQFIFPGIIGMSVLFSAIFGAMSIVWDREFGFLKEVLVAPIDRSAQRPSSIAWYGCILGMTPSFANRGISAGAMCCACSIRKRRSRGPFALATRS